MDWDVGFSSQGFYAYCGFTGLAVILKRQRITIYMLKMNARLYCEQGSQFKILYLHLWTVDCRNWGYFIFKTAFVGKSTLFAEWASIFAIPHLLLVLQSLLLMEKNAKNGGEFYECVRSSEFIKVI